MGIERITKKLVPALHDINGAVLMLNAMDPQLATFTLFAGAVSHLDNFVIVNKVDKVTETEAEILASKFPDRQIVLASITEKRGLDEIKDRLEEFISGKVVILGSFNSGKTSLINALTGENNPVGNIPGTTLELSRHPYKHLTLIDTVGQVVDISKPLMVSIDLTDCKTIGDKLEKCMVEDMWGIENSIEGSMIGLGKAVKLIQEQVEKGGKVVTCGAGASALVAMEIAGQGQETGLPIMCFTNNLATAQPISFAKGTEEMEMSLAEYFARAVQEGDVVIGVSASGGTGFVYKFVELSRSMGARTIAITENIDTPLGEAADIIIKSDAKPEGPSSSKIQVAQLAIGHALIITLADLRGIDAEKSIGFMLPQKIPNKRMGIK